MPGGGPSYPTGAPTRVWVGALTPTSFSYNADITQTALGARIKVSVNSDMSNPLFVSAFMPPSQTTGAVLSYHTFAFNVTGLTPSTKYYYQLEFQAAASQGDIIRSLTTPPTTAAAFTFTFGSCAAIISFLTSSVRIGVVAPVFTSIANDNPLFNLSMGDTPYSEVAIPNYSQRDLYREFRNNLQFQSMCNTVPQLWVMSDHDYMTNDCSLDTPNALTVFPITQQVFAETCPNYPLAALGGLLVQVANFGTTRHLMLDAYGAATYVGNTCLGTAQLAWLQQQLNQAVTDGVTWLFISQGRTWTAGGSGFNGFSDAFPAEQKQICDMIEGCMVPVCLLVGDAHAQAADDGTNTAVSTDGNAFFPQLLSSAYYQISSSASGPYSWNGSSLYFHPGPAGQNVSMYQKLTMSADNKNWTSVIKGPPFDGSSNLATLATVSSSDVTRAASFDNAAISATHGQPFNVQIDVTWWGAASVNWSFNGQSGTLNLRPNAKNTILTLTAPAAGSYPLTLSSPVGCTISGTNPATVTVT